MKQSQKLMKEVTVEKIAASGVDGELEQAFALQQSANFTPTTLSNSMLGVKKTVSCYLDVRGAAGGFKKQCEAFSEANLLKGHSGKTSYVSYPNRSNQILEGRGNKRSKILAARKELNIETKVLAGLSGCLDNEIRQNKLLKTRKRPQTTKAESASRHEKLSERFASGHPLSPVDEYIASLGKEADKAPENPQDEAPRQSEHAGTRSPSQLQHLHLHRADPYWKWDWEEFRKVEDFDEREAMSKLPE